MFSIHMCFQDNSPPTFKNELIIERGASLQLRPSLEALRREAVDLETQIRQLQVRKPITLKRFLPMTIKMNTNFLICAFFPMSLLSLSLAIIVN